MRGARLETENLPGKVEGRYLPAAVSQQTEDPHGTERYLVDGLRPLALGVDLGAFGEDRVRSLGAVERSVRQRRTCSDAGRHCQLGSGLQWHGGLPRQIGTATISQSAKEENSVLSLGELPRRRPCRRRPRRHAPSRSGAVRAAVL